MQIQLAATTVAFQLLFCGNNRNLPDGNDDCGRTQRYQQAGFWRGIEQPQDVAREHDDSVVHAMVTI